MLTFFSNLRNRIGDFWWYSLLLFVACRSADAINAIVGLWLVPKYVPAADLGAVMPLMNFATFIALPSSIFAMTFMKELTTLALNHEFGRLKSLMRGVFIGVGVFILLSILVSKFTLPLFLERIRVVDGSLGLLILASAFLSCVCPIYTNALQALRHFGANSFINIFSAPVRLLSMLLTMPFRALSGYFVGQICPALFHIFAAVFFLRGELSVKAEPYWNRQTFRRLFHLFLLVGLLNLFNSSTTLIESTIIRQRLPELESAAYYMATRFSEISTFLMMTLSAMIFPFTAELAANRRSTSPLLMKTILASVLFAAAIAVIFIPFGRPILAALPGGDIYSHFAWTIPWLVGIATMTSVASLYTTVEISAGRFSFLWWWVAIDAIYPLMLMLATGYGYFINILPSSTITLLQRLNPASLGEILVWFTIAGLIRTGFVVFGLFRARRQTP